MNTQKETTKKASAPETRTPHTPGKTFRRPGTHRGFKSATGEGNAPRDFFNLNTPNREDSAYSHHEYKDIDVRHLTRGQLIESYCDLKARNAELLAALKEKPSWAEIGAMNEAVQALKKLVFIHDKTDGESDAPGIREAKAAIANVEGRAQ